MELDHEFIVPVPVKQAWPVLLDVPRVAPCMPGATLDSIDGDEITGRLKVRLGAMTITYKGTARIASRDESTYSVTMEGSGKEARGTGTATATVQAQLHEEDGQTRVTVHTKLNVTGRPAQFGRNMLSEVGARLIKRFADRLAEELRSEPPALAAVEDAATDEEEGAQAPATVTRINDIPHPPRSAVDTSSPRRDDDAVNLLAVAGPSVVKRAAPVVAGLAALLAIRQLLRRRRGRHR